MRRRASADRRGARRHVVAAAILVALAGIVQVLLVQAYGDMRTVGTALSRSAFLTGELSNVQREALYLRAEAEAYGRTHDAAALDLRRGLFGRQLDVAFSFGEKRLHQALHEIDDRVPELDEALAALRASAGSGPAVARVAQILREIERGTKSLYDREHSLVERMLGAGQAARERSLRLLIGVGVLAIALGFLLATDVRRTVRRDFERARRALDDESAQRSAAELERADLEAQLEHRAFHDSLTGLANRAMFRARVDASLATAAEGGPSAHVIALDLDDFKRVNDSLGHAAGDAVLVEVAGRLRAAVRPGDVVARLGGDEFALLVDPAAGPEDPARVAARVLESLGRPFAVDGHDPVVGATLGLASSDGIAAATDDLLRNADVALSRAKAEGRGRLVVFEERMHQESLRRIELDMDLRRAPERGELELRYQPVVSLRDGRISGFEALVRWNHPRHGLLGPGEFVPAAEESGQIVDIGRWVLREACLRWTEWNASHPGSRIGMAVNLSPRQLEDPRLVDDVAWIMRETRIDPAALTLEITEGFLMQDQAAAVAKLAQLRALGIRLAIDDFGTGYSSLGYLRRLPVDVLKVDKSFVQGVGHGIEESAFLRAVVRLVRTLRLKTVVEGVERPEQLEEIRSIGVEYAQGYYFSKPVEAPEAAAMLARGSPFGAPATPDAPTAVAVAG